MNFSSTLDDWSNMDSFDLDAMITQVNTSMYGTDAEREALSSAPFVFDATPAVFVPQPGYDRVDVSCSASAEGPSMVMNDLLYKAGIVQTPNAAGVFNPMAMPISEMGGYLWFSEKRFTKVFAPLRQGSLVDWVRLLSTPEQIDGLRNYLAMSRYPFGWGVVGGSVLVVPFAETYGTIAGALASVASGPSCMYREMYGQPYEVKSLDVAGPLMAAAITLMDPDHYPVAAVEQMAVNVLRHRATVMAIMDKKTLNPAFKLQVAMQRKPASVDDWCKFGGAVADRAFRAFVYGNWMARHSIQPQPSATDNLFRSDNDTGSRVRRQLVVYTVYWSPMDEYGHWGWRISNSRRIFDGRSSVSAGVREIGGRFTLLSHDLTSYSTGLTRKPRGVVVGCIFLSTTQKKGKPLLTYCPDEDVHEIRLLKDLLFYQPTMSSGLLGDVVRRIVCCMDVKTLIAYTSVDRAHMRIDGVRASELLFYSWPYGSVKEKEFEATTMRMSVRDVIRSLIYVLDITSIRTFEWDLAPGLANIVPFQFLFGRMFASIVPASTRTRTECAWHLPAPRGDDGVKDLPHDHVRRSWVDQREMLNRGTEDAEYLGMCRPSLMFPADSLGGMGEEMAYGVGGREETDEYVPAVVVPMVRSGVARPQERFPLALDSGRVASDEHAFMIEYPIHGPVTNPAERGDDPGGQGEEKEEDGMHTGD